MTETIPDNTTLDDAVPRQSKYLTKEDVGQGLLLTVASVTMDEIEMDGRSERRTVLHFNGDSKPMVLNQTNKELLKVATGETTVGGIRGKTIVLFNDPTIMFRGEMKGGIRIRKAKNQPAPDFDEDEIPF